MGKGGRKKQGGYGPLFVLAGLVVLAAVLLVAPSGEDGGTAA